MIPPTIEEVLKKPHVQSLFKDQFLMTDAEIANLEKLIVKQCNQIIKNKSGGQGLSTSRS